MFAPVRVGMLAALVTFLPCVAFAADKAYQRDELDDSALKLEAQIKGEAGVVAKPLATLKREADVALERRELVNGARILGQIITLAPKESANWLRLSRTTQQMW